MKKTPVYILLWMTFQVPDIFEKKRVQYDKKKLFIKRRKITGLICLVCLFFANLESLTTYDWVDKGTLATRLSHPSTERSHRKNGKEIH